MIKKLILLHSEINMEHTKKLKHIDNNYLYLILIAKYFFKNIKNKYFIFQKEKNILAAKTKSDLDRLDNYFNENNNYLALLKKNP